MKIIRPDEGAHGRSTAPGGGVRLACALLAACLTAPGAAAPYVPDSDDAVLLEVAPSDDAAVARLRQLREATRRAPDNVRLVSEFARAAIEHARATADPRWLGYAESALRAWNGRETVPSEIRMLRATIAQNRHRFDSALAELDAVIATDPDHLQARVTRAVIHTVKARYDAAIADCEAAADDNALLLATCTGAARSLRGDAGAALAALDRRLADGAGDPGLRLWALSLAAEIAARLGHEDAGARYRRALAAPGADTDQPLRVAFADFLLDAGQPDEAMQVLAPFAQAEDARLRLLRARKQLMAADERDDRDAWTRERRALQARFDAVRTRGGEDHYRERAYAALFLDDAPGRAVWLAAQNWRELKEPLDARLLLASAGAAGDAAAAAPVLDWMRRFDVQDARLRALAATLTDPS